MLNMKTFIEWQEMAEMAFFYLMRVVQFLPIQFCMYFFFVIVVAFRD